MPRPPKEDRIQDRAARVRLAVRARPYWRYLSQGFFLGYRRGARKGSWVVRLARESDGSPYQMAGLGEADDARAADGNSVLSYAQAFDKAMHWRELQFLRPVASALDPDITVRKAVEAYIERRNIRKAAQAGRAVNSDAQYKLTTHVLSDRKIADLALKDVSEVDLRAWQKRLILKKASSAQRLLNDFKAALNAAGSEHRRVLPGDLPVIIKHGLQLEAPAVLTARARENQILSDADIGKIVTAALAVDEDFGRLVAVLAATGARFAQIRRLLVGDALLEQQRLMVPQSFKGHKKDSQHIRIAIGDDIVALLRPIVDDRPLTAPLLERWLMKQITAVKWERHDRGPWKSPSEMARLWQVTLKKAGLPAAIIPYALRHSSIVRGLRVGLPIRLVAALHDTSVIMIERHYSRWIVDGLDELAARAVVPFVDLAATPQQHDLEKVDDG